MSIIDISEGAEMIARYKSHRPIMINDNYSISQLTLCETFDRVEILGILEQQDCTKMRAYFGMDENKNLRLIFVGVNDENEDILSDDIIIEKGERCPDACPPASELNP